MNWSRAHRLVLAVIAAVLGAGAVPVAAQAHGPTAPVASAYQARVSGVPTGLQADVVDGDLRMWLQVPPADTVTVLDYRGAPYLRFSGAGVFENVNSEMYYLNQTPIAEPPPPGLTRVTPPRWQRLSSAHAYNWHDGRLHALASVALAPGMTYAGRWQIPLLIDGHPAALRGGLWHAAAPSIVWFWPVAVLLLCLLAARRLRRSDLDLALARGLSLAVLAAIAAASCGRQLHGRPAVSAFNLVELGIILLLVGAATARVLTGRAGFLLYFVIAFAAVWEGITLLPTLVDGYVLMAVPAFVARTATVLCLGGGVGLLLLSFRLAERPDRLLARRPHARGETPEGPSGVAEPVV